jgi:hypothetical protein
MAAVLVCALGVAATAADNKRLTGRGLAVEITPKHQILQKTTT